MDRQDLTKSILQNVSSTLKQGSETISSMEGNISMKGHKEDVLILLTGSDWRLKEKLGELSKLKKHGISIYICLSFAAEKILNLNQINNILNPVEFYREEDLFDLDSIVSKHSRLILPNITVNTLSKISLGILDTVIPNIVWYFLALGETVYIDFNTVRKHKGMDIKNKAMKNTIENYVGKVKSMGVIDISEESYISQIVNEDFNKTIDKSLGNKIEGEKKVIVEKDIVKLQSNNPQFLVPKNSIITPLAKDKARELNIKIIKE